MNRMDRMRGINLFRGCELAARRSGTVDADAVRDGEVVDEVVLSKSVAIS